ncbi:hypothetical protein L1987_12376 [Smallanthus sonchifolius]|uniref:Uncharacterized protein n=1 Tax=Smallanthus sonchifolius TaxID=185202 RepID=A0ACB9JFX1_9ASTR|nr:hypothetical protein L1987_12376 [Smallanthus sonchifolius]
MTVATMASEVLVERQSLKKLTFKSLKRALDLFSPTHSQLPTPDPGSKKIRMSHKLHVEYCGIKSDSNQPVKSSSQNHLAPSNSNALVLLGTENSKKAGAQSDLTITPLRPKNIGDGNMTGKSTAVIPAHGTSERNLSTAALMERIPSRWPRPVWHAPWKNYRIWDVGSGRLRLTLTGHIEQVIGLAVSTRHTYMFSAGDDKQVKCWDLKQNKVIRSYHGHLSGVYCLALHPTIDLLLTGGRDSVCRVWDIRSKMQVYALPAHGDTVCKTMATLTHHKKSVRALAQHPTKDSFASASADNIKKFSLPRGEFLHNMLSWENITHTCGNSKYTGDNGSLWFWDWKSGHSFQQSQTIVQPGSLDSEAGIYALSYDITGSRLVTCEADKTIKMWKEDENATPETHPVNFKPPKDIRRF